VTKLTMKSSVISSLYLKTAAEIVQSVCDVV